VTVLETDCTTGEVTVRDATPAEVSAQASVTTTHKRIRDEEDTARKQREADLATVQAGPAASGFNAALVRLLS